MSLLTPEERRTFFMLPHDKQSELIAGISPADLLALDVDFEMWAHEGQLPPQSDGWRVWLMLAGRGFGKTRAGAEWIYRLGMIRPVRIALVAATIDEARAIMVEGASGILRVARARGRKLGWEPSRGRLRWPGGSEAQLFSGDNADGLRGPEHHLAWCDELAKWRQAEAAWHNLQMGLRAGPRPRALVTTTPRPMRLLERIRSDRWTVETGGRTADNLNLSRHFIEVMAATYGQTRLGRQELDGELIVDVEGSLWPRDLIERCRVLRDGPSTGSVPPQDERAWDRVVVGVDPPAGTNGDACGIVVCVRAGERYYVLADESVAGLSPGGWAKAVAGAAARWDADRVVAEANNGGEMVGDLLRMADSGLMPKLVHASRGKVARAEPVALLFEAGRAYFAGAFPELEDELSGLQAGGGYQGPGRSPDRADAMVWAMTELALARASVPRVRAL